MEQAELIRMANQIADFFKGYPREDALKEAATHLNNYWDPRMRKQLIRPSGQGRRRA